MRAPALNTHAKNLSKALAPYRLFASWIGTKECFLSAEEIDLIHIYTSVKARQSSAFLSGLSAIEAVNRLEVITLRLKTFLPHYIQWEFNHVKLYDILTQSGIKSLRELKHLSWNDVKLRYQHNLEKQVRQGKVISTVP